MEMETEIKESDLNIASFFIAKGLSLIRLEGTGHKTFIFLDPDNKAEHFRVDFVNNGMVPVQSFSAAQRQLKSLLYGDRN